MCLRYFKALPPGFQAPAQPPPPPNTDLILAQVQGQKTAADVETGRAKAQTERAQLLLEDDRERDKAALDAWTRTWVAAAQYGSPAPSLDEFKTAMASRVTPAVQLLGDLPTPSSPQPPATSPGGPGAPQPQGPPGMLGRPGMMARPGAAMGGGAPSMAPAVPPDPATNMAVKNALIGRGLPGAYGQIANRSLAGLVAGPGGPALPGPAPAGAG